ncbi:MAG TPA: ribbon-helix-helix protein, CopG family [Candidatus Poseidoniales archaeon]|nr:MAG: hypothetical protein CXT69_05005 [Euryarchaeota archaeon]HIG03839.1 ribbon-helix-helix protein, CopG family [Candidatus Poseidoniales archaeon]HIK78298.1 ribbon-helix-helix protein, CopG family [Candidatus Poseidoniales archaeon]
MTAPSNMVTFRLPEDLTFALDQKVGFDGMRNRSDVIREAVRVYLQQQPTLASMDTLTIEVGSAVKSRLAKLYELRGITPENAALQGMLEYIDKAIANELSEVDDLLLARLEEKRAEILPRQEYTE